MDNLLLESNNVLGQVGRQLAIIGDINRRYDTEFQNLLEQLQPTAGNTYELFTKIASSLFKSGISWGRVVALLGFGYRLALYVYQRGLTGFLGQISVVGDSSSFSLEVPPPLMFPVTVMPLRPGQDCSLKNREPDVPALLVPGSWRLEQDCRGWTVLHLPWNLYPVP
ncbi:hypothetical protein STEG23_033713, partial [Scotinomys teguina]